MKIAFFGTPDFAVPSLQELSSHFGVTAVITQPDRPSGRGLKLKLSPVKFKAQELRIPIHQPAKLNDFNEDFKKIDPDISIVAAYGKIIPEWILNHKMGALNVHASLLPEYRGAAPIQRALMEGRQETGVTIQKMVAELDAGDIIAQERITVNTEDTAGTVYDKLALISADLLVDTIGKLPHIKPVKQDENKVTWAQKIEKDDAIINWDESHVKMFNLIRALNPAPGAKTFFKGTAIKIWKVSLSSEDGRPGQVLEAGKGGFKVACGQGSVILEIVQPENKNKMKGFEYALNTGIIEGEIIIGNP